MIYYFLLFYKHRRTFLWLKNQQNLDLQTREVLVLFFSFCASCLLDLINSIATTQKCSCVNSCSISLALDLSGGYLTSFVFALAHTKSTHSNKRRRSRVFFYCEKIQLSCFVVEIIADLPSKTGASDDPRGRRFDKVKSVRLHAFESVFDNKKTTHGRFFLVEIIGFEPMTPCLQGRCSSQLSHTPII